MTSLLEVEGASIVGRLEATNLAIEAGTMVALVGPNGGGKTSLLRAIAGVEEADGAVRIAGERLDAVGPIRRARLVGLLPASRDLVWPITVQALCALGHRDRHAVGQAMDLLELGPLARHRVDHLSTGERSRALLARIFAADPRVMLLDEPLSNLDPYWVLRVLDIVAARVKERQSAALVSLHDLHQVERFDRLMAIADGTVRYDGTPEGFMKSNDLRAIFKITREGDRFVL